MTLDGTDDNLIKVRGLLDWKPPEATDIQLPEAAQEKVEAQMKLWVTPSTESDKEQSEEDSFTEVSCSEESESRYTVTDYGFAAEMVEADLDPTVQACTYVCMCVCMYVCLYVRMCKCAYVVCMYVCMYIRMYVRMCV